MAAAIRSHTKSVWAAPAHILSNFSVQYCFGSTAVAIIIMSADYCTAAEELCLQGVQAPWVAGTVNAASFAGAVVGQLTMGYVGDIIGRLNAFFLTMTIATAGNILSAITPYGSPTAVYVLIVVFRFFMGIGLGGVYPLSATKAAEDNGTIDADKVDPRSAARAFFWQMPGISGPWLIAYFMTFNNTLSTSQRWRILLGSGAIPTGLAAICLYFERKGEEQVSANIVRSQQAAKPHLAGYQGGNEESPGSTDDDGDGREMDAEAGNESGSKGSRHSKNSLNANRRFGASTATTVSSLTDSFASHLSRKRSSLSDIDQRNHLARHSQIRVQNMSLRQKLVHEANTDKYFYRKFMVSGMCWFLFDVVVFGVSLFTGEMIHGIMGNTPNISSNASVRLLTSCALIFQTTAIPATLLVVLSLPYVSLGVLQIFGFLVLGAGCLLFGCCFYSLRELFPKSLFAIYVFLGFTMQCGINVTSYVFPSLMFRKEVRASFNGVAAAMGKSGAVVGAYTFPLVAEHVHKGYSLVMFICLIICCIGAFITWSLLVPSMLHDVHDTAGIKGDPSAGRIHARQDDPPERVAQDTYMPPHVDDADSIREGSFVEMRSSNKSHKSSHSTGNILAKNLEKNEKNVSVTNPLVAHSIQANEHEMTEGDESEPLAASHIAERNK